MQQKNAYIFLNVTVLSVEENPKLLFWENVTTNVLSTLLRRLQERREQFSIFFDREKKVTIIWYLNTKLYVHEVKFSVIYVKFHKKEMFCLVLWERINYVPFCYIVQCAPPPYPLYQEPQKKVPRPFFSLFIFLNHYTPSARWSLREFFLYCPLCVEACLAEGPPL